MAVQLVAVSDAVLVGMVGLAGVVVTALGGVIVAALGRDVKNRRASVNQTVEDFEAAWARRGQLLDGLGSDLDAAYSRIASLEQREHTCQESLAEALIRIDTLEGIIERRRRPRG